MPDFPPWSVKTLLLWILWFLVLSIILGGLSGIGVAMVATKYDLNLNPGDQLFIGRLIGQAVFIIAMFYFIQLRFKWTEFYLHSVWFLKRIDQRHMGMGLLLGILLMSISAWFSKAITGNVSPPPIHPIQFDWRIVLPLEFLVYGFMVGVVEEIFFRGLLYRALRRTYSAPWAVFLSAIPFTAFHIELILNPLNTITIFIFGVFAAMLFERTRSLNPCIGCHVSANITVFMIYYLSSHLSKIGLRNW